MAFEAIINEPAFLYVPESLLLHPSNTHDRIQISFDHGEYSSVLRQGTIHVVAVIIDWWNGSQIPSTISILSFCLQD
jgi:hypothetical protein